MANFKMRLFPYVFLLVFCFIAGCNNNVDCQAPPPSFYFKVATDSLIYPTPADTATKIMISYLDGNQQKTITDLTENEGLYKSSEIITHSFNLNNPEFTIAVNGKDLTKLRFETYLNNAKCQGWPTVSNVYENGQLLEKTENRFFSLGKK